MRILFFVVLMSRAMAAGAAQWYEPGQAGHGLTVEAVGDQYLATWVTHDGRNARWITSDLCVWGEECRSEERRVGKGRRTRGGEGHGHTSTDRRRQQTHE